MLFLRFQRVSLPLCQTTPDATHAEFWRAEGADSRLSIPLHFRFRTGVPVAGSGGLSILNTNSFATSTGGTFCWPAGWQLILCDHHDHLSAVREFARTSTKPFAFAKFVRCFLTDPTW